MIHLFGGMGMGDVKYAGVIGLYLGSLGWTYLYLGSLISFVGAALWVLPQMLSNRENRNVPFGPFMALGVVASGFIAIGVTAGA
jgi:leader peptidase (prepilin peptidase) / N-methyltransferase